MKHLERMAELTRKISLDWFKKPLQTTSLSEYIELLKTGGSREVQVIPSRNRLEESIEDTPIFLTFEYYVLVQSSTEKGRKIHCRQSCDIKALENPIFRFSENLFRNYEDLQIRTVLTAKETLDKIKSEIPNIAGNIWVK